MPVTSRLPTAAIDPMLDDVPSLRRMGAEVDRLLAARGAAHLIVPPPGSTDPAARRRPWRVDPVPVVLDGPTFDLLATAVVDRMRGLERLVADLYGPRRCVQEGIVPAEALAESGSYRLAQVGMVAPLRWLVTYAVDVVGLRDGTWRVVQDRTDCPTGIGFSLLDRSVMVRVAADRLGGTTFATVASITGFASELRRALASATSVTGARVVVFTGGPDDPAYVEHSYLARQLGFHLVEAEDLVVRRQRLWLRTIGGLEPVDVVYRRMGDRHTDPVELFGPTRGGVPGLLGAVAERGVALANGHGAGVLEDPALVGYWPAAVELLTGEAWRLGAFDAAAERTGIATTPGLVDGELGEVASVIRLHAVAGPAGIRVMPGGNGRVLGHGDLATTPTTAVAKDVWVVGPHRSSPVIVGPRLDQVDLDASVPVRAAAAFFEVGRAVERASTLARALRAITLRGEQDPTLDDDTGGEWDPSMTAVLHTAASSTAGAQHRPAGTASDSAEPGPEGIEAASRSAFGRLSELVDTVVTEATSISEYLPQTSGRVLSRLAALRDELDVRQVGLDIADDLIADLAAFDGLWTESTVRGDAWRFGDLGKRIERADAVAGLIEACMPFEGGSLAQAVKCELMLAVDESLNAYRRRYRTDVEPAVAVEFVATHENNPRSLVSALRRARHHCVKLGWAAGVEVTEAALADAAGLVADPASAGALRVELAAMLELVRTVWFATPVNPVAMRSVRQLGAS